MIVFKKASVVLMILLVFFVAAGIAGAYYLGKSGLSISFNKLNIIQQIPSPVNQQEVATTRMPVVNEPLFSGKLTRLQNDLGLFKFSDADISNGVDKGIVYYETGTFMRGNYKNYKRIVAVRPPEGPGPATVYILATVDNKTYVLNDDTGDTKKYPETDYSNPFLFFNRSIVISADVLDTEQPLTISLNNQFALYRNFIPTESVQTQNMDSFNQPVYEYQIQVDFTNYSSLNSPTKFISLHGRPFEKNQYLENLTPTEKEKESFKEQYVAGTTEVIAIDETGLPFSYSLTWPAHMTKYRADKQNYETELAKFKEAEKNKASPLPDYPIWPSTPKMRLAKGEITSAAAIYDKYDMAFPQACGFDTDTLIVKNISDSDLEKIGNAGDVLLYLLKDKNHALLKTAYQVKISEPYKMMVESKDPNVKLPPDYAAYVAKNPLLFFKDNWGRWVMLGEYDFLLPGGCGKPVLYLYPEKPTEVTVQFENKMNFDVTIPTYQNEWRVLAAPSGKLIDLQPQLTDCQKIDTEKKGSEYAKISCQNNSYPYLYWAGNTFAKYPKVDGGWIVDAKNLTKFMSDKLDEVGFDKQEKADMLEYWLPQMQNKNAPWYRVSFLQTRQLNQFIPMTINPVPSHVYRVFLDWEPMASKPNVELIPQELEKVVRRGFTVVEWGGLRR
jgi:hypothetical protein